jgi:antitoxin ParD1/3/4
MRKLNVSLSDEFVDFVEREVASGEYASASEVVRDGLRLLQREKAAYHEKILILRREVGIGVAQARSGRLSTRRVAEIVAELDAENEHSALSHPQDPERSINQ